MYEDIRFEYIEDKSIYKYSNNQVLLIHNLDTIKNSCKKTDKVFSEEWIYKITLGYNLFEIQAILKNNGNFFKSHSMIIDEVVYIRNTEEEFSEL